MLGHNFCSGPLFAEIGPRAIQGLQTPLLGGATRRLAGAFAVGDACLGQFFQKKGRNDNYTPKTKRNDNKELQGSLQVSERGDSEEG